VEDGKLDKYIDRAHRDSLALPSRITLLTVASMVLVAMIPCLGWLNWAVAPLCLVPFTLGVVGLALSTGAAGDRRPHPGPHLAALIGGVLLFVVSAGRLVLGLGVF